MELLSPDRDICLTVDGPLGHSKRLDIRQIQHIGEGASLEIQVDPRKTVAARKHTQSRRPVISALKSDMVHVGITQNQ